MLTRRNFVQLSATALPLLSRTAFAAAGRTPVGLQLSTIGGLAKKDLPGTLKAVRAIGYDEVEMYNVGYDLPPATLRSMIIDAGLLPPASSHFEYVDLPKQLEYAKAMGLTYAICPMLPKDQWMSADGFHTAAKALNDWGRRAADLGLQFGFHNHDYEFRPFGDKTGFDILMSETDPKLVCLEMDCYWITQSGHDPVQMLQKLGSRIKMIHMKDRKAGFPSSFDMSTESAHFTEVGTGAIDWPAVIAAARKVGVSHYFVEHDRIGPEPLASLAVSYGNAKRFLS
jgi:sugar phosphate isomerase/epimerase